MRMNHIAYTACQSTIYFKNNRGEVLSRIMQCSRARVPITNYKITLAYCLGIFRRALAPFPKMNSILEKQVVH